MNGDDDEDEEEDYAADANTHIGTRKKLRRPVEQRKKGRLAKQCKPNMDIGAKYELDIYHRYS